MNAAALILLTRPRGSASGSVWLQLMAACLTTTISFVVATLAMVAWRVPSSELAYRVLAITLVGVLLIPLVTLGTAVARLAARSRDERLATLRLLGATSRQVRRLAVSEVTLLAALGVAVGTALATTVPLALGALTIHGARLTVAELWLPWWVWIGIPPALVLIAAVSALWGLRRVVLSPLGVRTRQQPPRLSWLRAVLAVGVVGLSLLLLQLISPGWGLTVIVGALGAVSLAVMGVLGVVGPLVVSVVARFSAGRTSDAARLIAARGVQDDPRAAWRSVSTLSLATLIVIPTGSLLGYLDAIQRSAQTTAITPEQLLLFADTRTLLLALVALAFIVVACQTALTQSADVAELRELSIALDRVGMPRPEIQRARRLRVTLPAHTAVLGAAAVSTTLAFPLVLTGILTAPPFSAAIVAVLGLGLGLIRLAVTLTRPVLRRVLDAPVRGE